MRSGITMMSIVLYVTLFFIFTIFAISFSTNMNISALSKKGEIYTNEQFDKLQYNIVKSAKASNDVSIISDSIVFSNNDTYKYDSDKMIIIKNDSILIKNVESFKIINYSDLNILKDSNVSIDSKNKLFAIELTLKKYDSKKSEQLFFNVGDRI